MKAQTIEEKAKCLKYKMIYGGRMTTRELLTVTQHSDSVSATLAAKTLENYVTRLELALLEEKVKNSVQLDTGNKVISIQELPEMMRHNILDAVADKLS